MSPARGRVTAIKSSDPGRFESVVYYVKIRHSKASFCSRSNHCSVLYLWVFLAPYESGDNFVNIFNEIRCYREDSGVINKVWKGPVPLG